MSDALQVLVLVAFQERHLDRLREVLGSRGTLIEAPGPHSDEELLKLLDEADVVIGEPAPQVLRQAKRVRWVQMTWAGTDLYTRGAVPFPADMRLTNVAGSVYGYIISQYVVGQVLSLAQNLPIYLRQQLDRTWHDVGAVMSIDGASVLIFGAGDLGTCTAQRLTGFHATCTGVCRDTTRPRPGFSQLVDLAQAEELLPSSDVLINCLPNTEKTAGWLNERRLHSMKSGSILVNVGRGNFIDCMALARVLAEGHLRGAALDVTDPEPLPPTHPLWFEPRCVITPHAAGGAFGKCDSTEDRICAVCCENLRRYLAAEPLTHQLY